MFIDTEATEMRTGALLQVGYEVVDVATGKTLRSFSSIVRPPPGVRVCSRATEVHGISLRRATEEGRDLREVLLAVIADANACDIVVAHDAASDHGLLVRECTRAGLRWPNRPLQCTQMLSTNICQLADAAGGPGPVARFKSPRLHEAHALLVGHVPEEQHDALADASACRRIWFAIRDTVFGGPGVGGAVRPPAA